MTKSASDKSIVHRGGCVAYAEYGSRAADGDSTLVVLLHSLGTDHTMWEPCLAMLSGRWIIAPDTVGHGASIGRAPQEVTVRHWVDDLDDLIASLDASSVVLVGVSMGGMQAIAYAAAHPDRVSAMVVADSFARLDSNLAHSKIEQQRQAVARGSMSEVADAYVANTFQAPYPDGAELVRTSMAALNPAEYLTTVEATFDIDILHLLPQVAARTLVLWGDRDTKAPRPLSEQIARGIPQGHLSVIPDAGHLPNIDNPEAFVREVVAFLDRERC